MAQFKLDYDKAQLLQISNDAFFFITEEEEPLDEENLEEAQEILDMFPNGFYIKEDWAFVKDSDLIEATFVPYIEVKNDENEDWDEYQYITKFQQTQIKWLDADHVRVWWYNSQNGTRELRGDFKVYTNQYGHKCFHTGNQDKEPEPGMSIYFLRHFKKKDTK